MEENPKSVFESLHKINVSEHVDKRKQGSSELTYLSWAWAWDYIKSLYPDASYTIYKDEQNRPYIEDPDFGIMCYTTVTIQGQTHEMWLPVMDGANKAMRRTSYTYMVRKKNYNTGEYCDEEKTVEAATMFDINKTIMRCLVKNIAMFGLGLYIYAGEDLPEEEAIKEKEAKDKAVADALSTALEKIKKCNDRKELSKIYTENISLQSEADFVTAIQERGNVLGLRIAKS